MEELRRKAEEHYGKGIPEEVCLLELGWYTEKVIVSYLACERYGSQRCHVKDNRRQGVISRRKLEEMKWCRYIGKVAWPKKAKAQQSGIQPRELGSTAKEGDSQREVRRTFRILREMWLNIGVEKIDMHEGIIIKALLDSGAMGMFMDKKTVARHGFKLQKLERLISIRNVDGTNNSGGAIIHQVEYNIYYKGYIERIKINVYDLGKTEIILGMLWLVAHNLEINWETREVKITRCPLLYSERSPKKEKVKRTVTLEEEKIVRWAIDNKEDWGKEKEMKKDHRKIKEMVPKRFLKWKKVFGKVESERMPTRKTWDHAIDLKEMFKP